MSEVTSLEGSWVEAPSRRVFSYRIWRPKTPSTLLVIVHGFGEHSGRYVPFADTLAGQGICVAAPDLWGHGRSGGSRGDVGSVSQCVTSLQAMTQQVLLPESGQMTYGVFGHSFGGLVAIQWAMHQSRPLQRVVVQSPLLEVGFPIPRWKKIAASLFARCWPTATLATGLDVRDLSHDPRVVQAYQTDPLVHSAMSARTYQSILQSRDDALRRAETIRVPVLLLYGTEDRMISVGAAQRWFDRLRCEKRCVAFPGCFHELHHEPVQGDVSQLVRDWVLAGQQGRTP